MQIAEYVVYELVIRFQMLNPSIGEYHYNKQTTAGIIVWTSTGIITIPEEMLTRQFSDPGSITDMELFLLLEKFELTSRQ